jgi:hypothetical protein
VGLPAHLEATCLVVLKPAFLAKTGMWSQRWAPLLIQQQCIRITPQNAIDTLLKRRLQMKQTR